MPHVPAFGFQFSYSVLSFVNASWNYSATRSTWFIRSFMVVFWLTIKLAEMVVDMFIGKIPDLLFCHLPEKGMHEAGI